VINVLSAAVALLHKPFLIGQFGYVTSVASELVAISFAGSIIREMPTIHSFSEIAGQSFAGLAASSLGAIVAIATLRTENSPRDHREV
jgi:hypothetical protein